MKKILLGTVIVAAIAYLLFSTLASDIQINKYDSRQAVIEQHAIEQGWIPGILPSSAYDIAETHSGDGKHEIFGVFSYKETDEQPLIAQLTDTGDDSHTLSWEDFLFRIDREKNQAKFRNKVQ